MIASLKRNTIFKPFYRLATAVSILFILNSFCHSQKISDTTDNLRKDALCIYIDCPLWDCDFDYIREEITFVNYVRDRKDAQVYILITTQRTGGGGKEYTITFIGKQDFNGINDTLKFTTKQNDTEELIRRELVRILKLGLIRYASKTPLADKISITYHAPIKPTKVVDKWDYWVLSIRTRGFFNGEKSVKSASLFGSLSANRTTDDLKINLSLYGNYDDKKYDYGKYSYRSISRGKGFSGLVVFSLSEHFSAGGSVSISSSTYTNLKLSLYGAPAIEYNLFPYSESTHRQLRFLYRIGFQVVNYEEETLYDKLKENLFNQSFLIAFDIKEQWGSAGISVRGANYFHDLKKYNISTHGNISFRLIHGLSLDLNGNYSHNRDQLSLPKRGATPEEVLLQRRALESSYDYFLSVGLSYTFGSIYNNIVNPRFGDIGGMRIISYN